MIGSVTCVCVAAGIAMRASATAASRSTIASPREDPDPGSAGGRARNRRITPQAAGGHRNSDSSCSSSENNYGNSNILKVLRSLNDSKKLLNCNCKLMLIAGLNESAMVPLDLQSEVKQHKR